MADKTYLMGGPLVGNNPGQKLATGKPAASVGLATCKTVTKKSIWTNGCVGMSVNGRQQGIFFKKEVWNMVLEFSICQEAERKFNLYFKNPVALTQTNYRHRWVELWVLWGCAGGWGCTISCAGLLVFLRIKHFSFIHNYFEFSLISLLKNELNFLKDCIAIRLKFFPGKILQLLYPAEYLRFVFFHDLIVF